MSGQEPYVIYVSAVTVYLYDSQERVMLNLEEADKFFEGMKKYGDADNYLILSHFRWKDLDELLGRLSEEEIKAFRNKVQAQIETRAITPKRVDLTSYDNTYRVVYKSLMGMLENGDKRYTVYVNVGCGHKPGALAAYIATLNVATELEKGTKKGRIVVKPFHAERNEIVPLPSVNIPGKPGARAYEKYLLVFRTPVTYEESRKIAQDMGFEGDWGATAKKLQKSGYIEMKDGKLMLTRRGSTLVALLSAL